MKRKVDSSRQDILKYVSASLTAAAVVTASLPAGVVGAEEIAAPPSNEQNLNDAPVVKATTTTPETASISYDREEAFDKQDNVFPNSDEKNEFIDHVVENNTPVTITDKDHLSNVIGEAIKNNDAVIVIDDVNDVLGDIALNGDNIIEEITKTGESAGALVSGYGLTTVLNEKGETVWVLMPYYEETNALAEAKTQYIDQVASYVNSNFSTPIEKLHAIYSFLGETTVYNENTNVPSSSPAALILENQAVCEAFAYLYNEIAKKSGFNMRYVTGTANNGVETIGHAWNLVELDGQWYNTDATWGNIDRNGENSLETNMSYFLFSDEKAQATHQRKDNSLPSATDSTYDALYNDKPNNVFGGGVTGDLIISPNTNEIVVFDTSTNQKSGVSIPTKTSDYQILSTALAGNDLFVTYLDYVVGEYKLAKLNVADGSFTDLFNNISNYGEVKYTKDGIFVADSLVHQYDSNASIISRDLSVYVQVGNDHNFALETAYNNFVVTHDTNVIAGLDNVFQGFTDATDAQEFAQAAYESISKIKDLEKRENQVAKVETHLTYLSVVSGLANYTDLTDTAVEEQLMAIANSLTDENLKARALKLISDKKDELTSQGETDPVDPVDPPETGGGTDPVDPPETGGGTDPVEPPETGGETDPVDTPVTGGGDNGNNGKPDPIEPPTEEKPIIPTPPVTDGGGNTGGEITPPGNNSGADNTVTPPTDNNSGQTETVTPPTDNKEETIAPPTEQEVENNVTISLPEGVGTEAVTVTTNEAGNYVVTSTVLSNTVAATITIPFVDNGKVLRLRTANGLEPVPYTVKDGVLVVQLHKAGELVFVDPKVELSDIASNQYRAQIEKLTARGIFTGDGDKFNPGANMTRAQFAGALVRALGLNTSDTKGNGFSDVSDGAWYAGGVAALAELGLMNGNEGKFNPAGTITRQQMFSVVGALLESRGVTASNTDIDGFKDIDKVSDYAKPYIAILVEIGAVNGDGGKLNPHDNITKGQMAKVLDTVLQHLEML